MGREIRRVPANWEHPKQRCKHYPQPIGCTEARQNGGLCSIPLCDMDFESEAREWMEKAIAWHEDKMSPDELKYKADYPFYWQWASDPPDPKYYRPKWTDEERTHYQVYENVSEGTPISPVFATPQEVVEWLVSDGGCDGPHSRKAATAFVYAGYAPSMIMSGGVLRMGIDALDEETS